MTSKPNFDNYRFHCSSLPKLMTNGRSKTDELSKTAQSYLDEVWIEEVYGRKKYISSPAMEKGTVVESDSLQLLCDIDGVTLFKNNKELSNGFVVGTPDVVKPVIDIKSSWDIWTFHNVTEDSATSDYYWQLAGYAMLRRVKTARLVYVLVNTPEHLIYEEMRKLSYSMTEQEAEEIVRKNHEYDDVPKEERIKSYTFTYSKEDLDSIKDKVMFAREYLNNSRL